MLLDIWKRYLKIKPVIFLLLIPFVFIQCGGNKLSKLKRTFGKNRSVFETTATQFLNEPNLMHLRIAADDYYSGGWNLINHWSYRPDTDEKWWNIDAETGKRTYLNSLEEVLANENIPLQVYASYVDFLKKYKLSSISRVTPNSLEMEAVGVGLHYMKTANPEENNGHLLTGLKEGHEYLQVGKIDDRWFVYYRDWN